MQGTSPIHPPVELESQEVTLVLETGVKDEGSANVEISDAEASTEESENVIVTPPQELEVASEATEAVIDHKTPEETLPDVRQEVAELVESIERGSFIKEVSIFIPGGEQCDSNVVDLG